MQFWKAWANSGRISTSRLFFSSRRSLRALTASLIAFSSLARSTVYRMSATHLRLRPSQSRSSGRCLRAAAEVLASSSIASTVRPSICGTVATRILSLEMY